MSRFAHDSTGLWQLLRQKRSSRYALYALVFILFVAVFADFIANDKPLYCRYEGRVYFPVLRTCFFQQMPREWPEAMQRNQWKEMEYESVIWPLIPYSASELDARNARFTGPFGKQHIPSLRFRHWLGTDQLGRDLLAGMIYGTRIAMLVGFTSMSIAALLGIFLGGLAGYFGDERLQVTPLQLILTLLGLFLGFFYAFVVRGYALQTALSEGRVILPLITSLLLLIGIPVFLNRLGARLGSLPFLAKAGKKRPLPIDMLVMRLIELINSIPDLLLILAIVAILPKPSILYIMVVIGLITWTGIARFVRAELLQIREQNYIWSARVMGFPEKHILWKHALPNALGPVWIAIAFGFAGAILTEATISFLGLGLAPDEVSWGSLLRSARSNISAWWMAVFPGLAIFATITIFNLLGEQLKQNYPS